MITNLGYRCSTCNATGNRPCEPSCPARQQREREALRKTVEIMSAQPRCPNYGDDHMAVRMSSGLVHCFHCAPDGPVRVQIEEEAAE